MFKTQIESSNVRHYCVYIVTFVIVNYVFAIGGVLFVVVLNFSLLRAHLG